MISYDIVENGYIVGTAEIETEGLYLNVRARCSPRDKQIHRLILFSSAGQIDLGVCVPEDNVYVVNKRVQRKLIGEDVLQFILEPKENAGQRQFVPVDSGKPFAYLDVLHSCYFENRSGIYGVVLISK